MNAIGIFAKTFARPTLDETLAAVRAHGFEVVQFNLSCAGLPTLPETLPDETVRCIRQSLDAHGIRVAALSGTFNMIHPQRAQRMEGLRRVNLLLTQAQALGAPLVTLCTGTRDPDDMWRAHPDNHTPAAWDDLLESVSRAVSAAERYSVDLGIEPEISNVVDSAARARALLDAVQSPRLKIVLDGANLFPTGTLNQMSERLAEAFVLLEDEIALVHAKDLTHDGEAGQTAAGKGVLDYPLYLRLIREAGYSGPLILHGLGEDEVAGSLAFLRGLMGAG